MCCVNGVLVILIFSVSLCGCFNDEFHHIRDHNQDFDDSNPDFGGDFPPPYFHSGDYAMEMMHHHNHFDPNLDPSPDPPDALYPVLHAGLPLDLAVYPLPLQDSDHELMFNVSWHPAYGPPARDYSIEISSITDTHDCQSPMCYEYDIPGGSTWWLIPKYPSPIAGTCAVYPGCAYVVRLIAHPWDGHTAANLHVELAECEAGVCSCGHYSNLPIPVVKARTVSINGDIFVNITWTTPPPKEPKRLPPGLKIQRYAVSVAKQTISDVFANTVTRYVDADGVVADGDVTRYLVMPITERTTEQRDEPRDQLRRIKTRTLVLDVRLLARVKLVDDRGCIGPEGSATAYDPVEATKVSFGTYILWAVFGGACIAVMCALIAASARVVKRILNAFRPAPVSAPPETSRRPAWFPMQLHT